MVGLIADGADVAAVAGASITAAERGIDLAASDAGLRESVRLITQLALAGREDDTAAALSESGIELSAGAGVFDLVAAVSEALDRRIATSDRTDIGEMAQLAAVETLSTIGESKAASLFPGAAPDVLNTLKHLSTPAGYRTLAHTFFSRFIERYLEYHLSRELSRHVGHNQRFGDPSDHNRFLESLGTHSAQVALILKEFAEGWYSKAVWKDRVSAPHVDAFTSYALTKIRQELRVRGQQDDD